MITLPNTGLSRKELIQQNPIGWIILLIVMMYILFIFFISRMGEWKKEFFTIRRNTPLIQQLDTQNKTLEATLTQKQEELKKLSEKYLLIEKQIFPEKMDIVKVIQILEIYALKLENLSTSSYKPYFYLDSVNFGETQKDDQAGYSKTDVMIHFNADDLNIKEFINFLQTGELSKRFEDGKNQIPKNDYIFLQNNFLPIVHVESVNITPSSDKDKTSNSSSVDIKTTFFSQ